MKYFFHSHPLCLPWNYLEPPSGGPPHTLKTSDLNYGSLNLGPLPRSSPTQHHLEHTEFLIIFLLSLLLWTGTGFIIKYDYSHWDCQQTQYTSLSTLFPLTVLSCPSLASFAPRAPGTLWPLVAVTKPDGVWSVRSEETNHEAVVCHCHITDLNIELYRKEK